MFLVEEEGRGIGFSRLVPERTVLEGQHGTLAEVHADVALTQADLTHQYVADQLNTQVVDPLLALNFGPHACGMIQVVPAPIADAKQSFFRNLYQTLLSNRNFQAHELSALDLDALKGTLGLPKSKEVDTLGKQSVSPSLQSSSALACPSSFSDKGHWVTIKGKHILNDGSAPRAWIQRLCPTIRHDLHRPSGTNAIPRHHSLPLPHYSIITQYGAIALGVEGLQAGLTRRPKSKHLDRLKVRDGVNVPTRGGGRPTLTASSSSHSSRRLP